MDEMNNFEERLKGLPLRRPPQGLQARIFDGRPARSRAAVVIGWRMPLPWAAVLALGMGIAGFMAARLTGNAGDAGQTSAEGTGSTVTIQIIEAPPGGNPFDFTEVSDDFFPGDGAVQVTSESEAQS